MEVIGALFEATKDYDKVHLHTIAKNEAKFASIFGLN